MKIISKQISGDAIYHAPSDLIAQTVYLDPNAKPNAGPFYAEWRIISRTNTNTLWGRICYRFEAEPKSED